MMHTLCDGRQKLCSHRWVGYLLTRECQQGYDIETAYGDLQLEYPEISSSAAKQALRHHATKSIVRAGSRRYENSAEIATYV
jgi:hypothetical protein